MFFNITFLVLLGIFIIGIVGGLIYIIYRENTAIKTMRRQIQNIDRTTQIIRDESGAEYKENTKELLNKVKTIIKEALNKQRLELEEKYFDKNSDIPLIAKTTVQQLEKEIALLSSFDDKPPKVRLAILNDILSRYDETQLEVLFGFDVREKKKNLYYDKDRLEKFMEKIK